MRQIAQLKRERVARRINLFISILETLLILALAFIVLFVAVACMSPLVNLISGLSG